MSGTYYKIKDDGALWRCSECKELKSAYSVILFENTNTKKTKVLCTECVDPDWVTTAICIGTK